MFYDTIECMHTIAGKPDDVKICPTLLLDDEHNAIGLHEFTQEYAVFVSGEEFKMAIKDDDIKVPNDFPDDLFPLVKEKLCRKYNRSIRNSKNLTVIQRLCDEIYPDAG